MDQSSIGRFIYTKRREQNMTQEQLAEKLGVTNKAISKWENGKCMPDYSVIEGLCRELDITLAELLDGEETEPHSIRVYDEEEVKTLLAKIDKIEKKYRYATGAMMIVVGFLSMVLGRVLGGTDAQDFLSGFLAGLGACWIAVGIISMIFSLKKGKRN